MDTLEFSDWLVHLNTAIEKYLEAKKARDIVGSSFRNYGITAEVSNTILDVLGEKICQYEKQIIELATKLTQAKDGDGTKKN